MGIEKGRVRFRRVRAAAVPWREEAKRREKMKRREGRRLIFVGTLLG